METKEQKRKSISNRIASIFGTTTQKPLAEYRGTLQCCTSRRGILSEADIPESCLNKGKKRGVFLIRHLSFGPNLRYSIVCSECATAILDKIEPQLKQFSHILKYRKLRINQNNLAIMFRESKEVLLRDAIGNVLDAIERSTEPWLDYSDGGLRLIQSKVFMRIEYMSIRGPYAMYVPISCVLKFNGAHAEMI